MQTLRVKIKRQDRQTGEPYQQDFDVKVESDMTLISVLKNIQRRPVTDEDIAVAPVVWESQCHKGQCGSCTMLVNGQVKLACTTKVSALGSSVFLEPLSKFPIVRDLQVDRSNLFSSVEKIYPHEELNFFSEAAHHLSVSVSAIINEPRDSDDLAKSLATCIQCGACVEACPQYGTQSAPHSQGYYGPLALAQSYRRQKVSRDSLLKQQRLESLMQPGGTADCENAQNCVKACPVEIPLTDAIGRIKRQTLGFAFKKIFE